MPSKFKGVMSMFEGMDPNTRSQRMKEGYLPMIAGADSAQFITPHMVARVGIPTLINNLVLGQLCWKDFDADFAGKVGDYVTIRRPAVFEAKEYDRTNGIDLQDITEQGVPVHLDTILDVSFPVTSEELTLDIDDFAVRLLNPAMLALAVKIDRFIGNAVVAAANSAGGQITLPDGKTSTQPAGGGVAHLSTKYTQPGFPTNTMTGSSALIDARQILTRNKLPLNNRYAVLSPEATSICLTDPQFVRAQEAGSTDALREANIGRAFGIDTYESGQFGLHHQFDEDVDNVDGVSFHQTAVTLVNRPMQAPNGVAPNMVSVQNWMGWSLRVVYMYDINKKQDVVSIDFLCGTAATRPQAAIVLDYGQSMS